MPPMRVLVAPDKLKGSSTAQAAARAMARGVERAGHGPAVELPLADGGEGTLDAVLGALGGELRTAPIHDALGAPILARFGLLDAGRTALVESAEAVGLARLARRNAVLDATSFGVGELIRAALDQGVARVVVALGGSATNDGGAGAAQALGAELAGVPTPARARDLPSISAVDTSRMDARLGEIELVALCDVTSPLTGPAGASLMFGPQKGASPEQARELDAALARLAAHFTLDTALPGMGAAGGLGFGLAAFAGARLVGGASWVLDRLELERRAQACQLVLTAEGRLDEQTLAGKLVAALGGRAKALGIPVIALAGRVEVELSALAEHGIAAAFPLADRPMDEAESVARAGELLALAAERAVRAFAAGRLSATSTGRAP